MSRPSNLPLRILLWGTYDTGKPRVRILRQGLRDAEVDLVELHVDLWRGIEDKSSIRGIRRWCGLSLRAVVAYPRLIARFLSTPKPDLVLVSYPGLIDVLVLRPFAWLRGIPMAWDWFVSAYDTLVLDRRLISPRNPLAWLIWALERIAANAATLAFMDTQAHAARLETKFRLLPGSLGTVWVGAETSIFSPDKPQSRQIPIKQRRPLQVLFYGQFIPLHGVDVIIEAARMSRADIDWIIIGRGQEAGRIRETLDRDPVPRLTWIEWVQYTELMEWIIDSDICLGIFGNSGKAASVIPNKVFQVVSAGRPLITRDSPAIRELLDPVPAGARLIPPLDPQALLGAIESLAHQLPRHPQLDVQSSSLRDRISPSAVARQFMNLVHTRITQVPQ